MVAKYIFGRRLVFAAAVGLIVIAVESTSAQGRGGFTLESAAAMGLETTGLDVSFPSGARCEGIASPYGSDTRYDGSPRPVFRMAGLHGGMDISLDTGTPLLAVADATVLAMDEGGRATGIYVWLRFDPDATGLGYYVYAKYQHLDKFPDLKVGDKLRAGQPFAVSGETGTVGRAFEFGYPHLHMTTFASKRGDVTERFGPTLREHGRMIDPLAIYLDPAQFAKIYAETTALDGTSVTPSVMLPSGNIGALRPARYWPVARKAR